MKALVKPYKKTDGLELAEVPMPEIRDPRDVLLKVLAASVCGTDLHIYGSDPSIRDRIADRQTIGHEFCGEVMEVGDQVTTLAKGDIVSSESHIVCGTCEYCLVGMPHLCQEVSLLGIDRRGGLAEYVVVPEQNAIPMRSPNISAEVASTLDAFGNAVDTSLLVPLIGKTVLITGCGPQGLMAIGIALAAGAKQVIATETKTNRRKLAKDMLDKHVNPNQTWRNDLILNANDKTVVDQIFEATNGLGVDVLLEMAGHPSAIRDGFFALKNAGHAVILGITSSPIVEVDWANLVFKGATIHFRYGRHLYRTWAQGRDLLETGLVKLEPLIHQPYFSLDDFEEAFNLQITGEVAKVVFKPNG